MSATRLPDPEEVGALYDGLDEMDVLHFGYWPDGDDETPVERAAERLTDVVGERVGAMAGLRLIDVGCGIGMPAVRLAGRMGADITGVTVSRKQVERATRLAAAQGISGKVRFEYADAMNMPFPDELFDAAYALESIIHMDRVTALKEISRVIRPGGRIVLTDVFEHTPVAPGATSLMSFMVEAWRMSPPVQRDGYTALSAEAGLELLDVEDVSEQVMFKTLRAVARQMRENVKPLIPDQIVDHIGDSYQNAPQDVPLDLPNLLENSRELGCLLVVLRRP
jgi:ubiquinone/menaquinone biosynthesis C-methylase UbiE